MTSVNLACGDSFVTESDWMNLDYSPTHPSVEKCDLLDKLPIHSSSIKTVYSSHFLEHIPRQRLTAFLQECHRILAKGGRIRLVLPDWENLCTEYLRARTDKEHEKANFTLLEMIDQCVRVHRGGLLGDYFAYLQNSPNSESEMIEYVKIRCGENLIKDNLVSGKPSLKATSSFQRLSIIKILITATRPVILMNKLSLKLAAFQIKLLTALLPKAFREQNISYAAIGEKHAWMWDFYTLSQELEKAGFHSIQRLSFDTSQITNFPLVPLDMTVDGRPRKGEGSMYIEAEK